MAVCVEPVQGFGQAFAHCCCVLHLLVYIFIKFINGSVHRVADKARCAEPSATPATMQRLVAVVPPGYTTISRRRAHLQTVVPK